jgi:hypothetical protein
MADPDMTDLAPPPGRTTDAPNVAPRKDRLYVAGGRGVDLVADSITLDWEITEETQAYGDATWDRVRRDYGVAASLKVLLAGVFAKPLVVLPNHTIRPDMSDDERPDEATLAMSADVARMVAWALEAMDRPIKDWGIEAVDDATAYGTKLAEKEYMTEPHGPYAGFVRYKSLDFKPRENWRFTIDRYGRADGVKVKTPDGTYQRLPLSKFAILTHGSRNGDPRGQSAYIPTWKPWSLRSQLWADYYRFLRRKADPALVIVDPPDADMPTSASDTGLEDEDAAIAMAVAKASCRMREDSRSSESLSPEARAKHEAAMAFQNGSYLWLGHGGSAFYLQSEGADEAFLNAFRVTLEAIVLTLLLNVTTTLDSQHNSRAASRTGQDVLGTYLLLVREWFCEFLAWWVGYDLVLWNYGPEVASQHTPKFSLGKVEPREVIALLDAMGRVDWRPAPGHLPIMDSWLDMPPRSESDIDAEREKRDTPPPAPPSGPNPNPAPPSDPDDAED